MTSETLSLSKSIALHEEAKKLIRVLRREIERNYPPPPGNYGSLSTMEDFLGDAERGGMAWKFITERVSFKEVDRCKSMVTGPFFITHKYPLPATNEGKFFLPCIQADLRALSKLRGLPLGNGLLQAFYADNDSMVRVIPRSVVNRQEPLPFPTDIELFDQSIQFLIESWMKDPEPSIQFHTLPEPGMWEDMVAERMGRMGADVSTDEKLGRTTIEFKNELTDEELEENEPPAAYARLIEIVELLEGTKPWGDQVFGSFHGIHSRPREIDADCLFAFESEFFCFSGAGNSHVMYEFIDGKPSFYFTEASCR